MSACAVLVTASLVHELFLAAANQISPFNTIQSSSSPTVNDSVFSSTMEAVWVILKIDDAAVICHCMRRNAPHGFNTS